MFSIRRIVLIAACVVAVLGALAIRVVVEGRAALRAGDEAAAKGATIAAIDQYETAARWYMPLAPHVDEAYRKLRAIAVAADRASPSANSATGSSPGDAAIALAAWRAIRSAARATRSLWTPHADDLAAADAAIARLSARDPNAGALGDEDKPASGPGAGSGANATTANGSATNATSRGSGAETTTGSGADATTANPRRSGAETTTGSGADATTANPHGSGAETTTGPGAAHATTANPRGSGAETTTGSGVDATTAHPRGSGSPLTPDEIAAREAWHRRRLAIDVRPSAFAAALAGLGILLWLGGVVALVRRGVDRAGAWVRRPAVVSGAAIVVGLVLWFVGLYNA